MTHQLSKIQQDLETFRHYFHKARKCCVSEKRDYVVYGYNDIRHAVTDCCEANKKIEELKLPLVAIHHQNSMSFHVQSNQTPDI
jgi:hypothetical protein